MISVIRQFQNGMRACVGLDARVCSGWFAVKQDLRLRRYFQYTHSIPIVGVVVLFFTLNDRTSTIPSTIGGCQSGTWSGGHKEIRRTSTKLHESKIKTQTNKNDKEKGTRIAKYTCQKKIDDGHSVERVWHSASREPSDTLPGSQPCTQTRSIYHIPYSQGFSFH